jgi:hypothetical protein
LSRKKVKINWKILSNEALLDVRIKDLGVEISDSPLEPLIQRLYEELAVRNILFRPPCYLADEWLCPDKEPIIGIPFWLAHPRLKSIEMEQMFEAEGADHATCMKLLRHECGHAINYAYQLYSRTRWRELFGPFSRKYSDQYRFQPYSRRFVVHLDDYYAQSHPDEDFAETFAVWLSPENQWRKKYAKWPALKKLLYVDSLMKKIGDVSPLKTACPSPPWAASRMRSTLKSYYERRQNALGREFKGYYDDSLKVVFSDVQKGEESIKAARLLRKNKRLIANHLAKWSGHRKFDLHELIERFITRCEVLDLYATDHLKDLIGVTTLLTAIACGTGRHTLQGKL